VDLWINTPRRPWEACGTSGMKVLVNGGINSRNWTAGGGSLHSGGGVGVGDGLEHGDDPTWDGVEPTHSMTCSSERWSRNFTNGPEWNSHRVDQADAGKHG